MRRKKLVMLIGSICLTLVLAAMSFLAACPAPVEEEPPITVEKEYSILNPRGFLGDVELVPLNPRSPTLDGKTVYFVGFQSQELARLISETFQRVVPGANVAYLETKETHVEYPEIWEEVAQKAEAAVVGVGSCGGMAPLGAKYTANVEKSGVPAVYIVYDKFEETARLSATREGMPFLRTLYVKTGEDDKIIADKIVAPIVDALTVSLAGDETKIGTYSPEKPSRIAATGTMGELQYKFQECFLGWTDGLPVIPPTEGKVAEMLKGTSHSPDEVVGTMWPEKWQFTVEKVAINGVMAGCSPRDMPVLLAMAEAFGGERAFLDECTSSTSFTFMTLVSGPITKEIGMNAGLNAFGPGNRPNTTLGRALRLFIINLGGGEPGVNLMSSEGNPMMYSWCIAEDYENSPWQPFHTDMGFKPDESCVTIFGGGWVWLESWGTGGLEGIIEQMKLIPEPFAVGVVISPKMAKSFAQEGLATRRAVQEYLWENCTQTVAEWSSTSWYNIMRGASVKNIYGRKFWPLENFELPSDAIVKTYARPELIYPIVSTEGEVIIKLQFPSTVSVDKWR